MSFVWAKISDNIPIPNGDGAGSCVLNGKMYSVGGWYPNGPSHNRVFVTDNPPNWTESAVPRPWSGRHTCPVITSGGLIRVIGGDVDTGAYEPNVQSWDGEETSSWVSESDIPALNRAGHWGIGDFHGYEMFGGGQTMTPVSSTPTKFFTDRWYREAGSFDPWQLLDDDCALGVRCFMGDPVVIDGEAYFVGGGTYTTADYPARDYRNDIMVMGGPPDFKIRCVNPKNQMPGMMYHSVAELAGVLFVVCGYNGSNLNTVWASYDKGETLVRIADFPGAATHAATLQKFGNSLYLWGGVATGQQMWRLKYTDPAKIHPGAPYNGTTNLSSQYTVYDLYQELEPGKTVDSVGLYLNNAKMVRPRIGYRSSAGVFDTVYRADSEVAHPGGGYADFPVGNFVVPGLGYYVGFTLAYGPGTPDAFSFGEYGRAMAAGDVTGDGVSFNEQSDGTLPMRWTEQ